METVKKEPRTQEIRVIWNRGSVSENEMLAL